MKLLLDTQCWLWWLAQGSNLLYHKAILNHS